MPSRVILRPARAALLATVLLASSGPTLAQGMPPGGRGLYVGAGGSYSTVSVEVGDYDDECCYWWGDYSDYDTGDGDVGYSVHAGLRLHPFVALEVAYLETGTIGWSQDLVYMPEFDDFYNNRVDFSAQVTEVSVLGILPFEDRYELYVRLGAGFYDGESEQRLDQSFGEEVVTRRVSDSGTGFLAGVGFGVMLSPAWHLRLDLQTVTIDEDVLNARDDSSVDSIVFELQYRFFRPAAPAVLPLGAAPTP